MSGPDVKIVIAALVTEGANWCSCFPHTLERRYGWGIISLEAQLPTGINPKSPLEYSV